MAADASTRGLLIVLEGLDRSGKSTQVQKLVEALLAAGHSVKHMRFPDRTTATGASINAYLQGSSDFSDHAIHLLFAANRWEAEARICADLAAGTTLIVDRYSFSGAVYSAAKQNPNLTLEWAWQPEIGLPEPDLVFYLTVSPEIAAQRGGFGGERYEKEEMQARVGDLFQTLLSKRLKFGPGQLTRVNADQTVQQVHEAILQTVQTELADTVGGKGPIARFKSLSP